MEMALHVRQPLSDRFFLDLRPYVVKTDGPEGTGRAGAFVEIGWTGDRLGVSMFHHSSHNLDVNGQAIEVDGISMKIRLN